MKKTIITLAMMCCAIVANAQVTDEQSAILQVGDNAQVFYGADALKEALEAAPDRGATITLSAGTFNACEITKCVNIYGAGWVTDNTPKNNESSIENSILPTNIVNQMVINLPEGLAAPHNIHIEGLRFTDNSQHWIKVSSTIDGLEFMRCWMPQAIRFEQQNDHVTITQCYIAGGCTGGHDLLIQNSYTRLSQLTVLKAESNIVVNHCIVTNGYNFNYTENRFLCLNSMFSCSWLNKAQTFRYCTLNRANLDGFVGSTNNIFNVDYATIFKDQANMEYSDTRTFELKDDLKATYMGDDNTEIGINGGNYPWNKAPHTPIVKDLQLTISGTNLKVTYNAETR